MDVRRLLDQKEVLSFAVDPAEAGVRLDVAVARRASWTSRMQVAKWIRAGRVRVDGEAERRPSRSLAAGVVVAVRVPKTPRDLEVPIDDLMALTVAGEGPGWRVVMKPAGVPCHPGGGSIRRTVLTALALAWEDRCEDGGPWLPHRLDRETSGLLVVTLSHATHQSFARAFRQGRIRRLYDARVRGRLGEPGAEIAIEAPLVSLGGRPARVGVGAGGLAARTRVRVRRILDDATEVEVEPISGRRHQIRVHLCHLGHPIVGDPLYDPGGVEEARMRLHASLLDIPADVAGTAEAQRVIAPVST